jgi:pyridoxal 5'-phosphate synthase pdxT subunit
VQVLAEHAGKPALVQKANLLASSFHPELTDDRAVHRHFLNMTKARAAKSA